MPLSLSSSAVLRRSPDPMPHRAYNYKNVMAAQRLVHAYRAGCRRQSRAKTDGLLSQSPVPNEQVIIYRHVLSLSLL